MSKVLHSLIGLIVLGALLVGALPVHGAPPLPNSLTQAARGALTITRDPATGAVTFVRSEGGLVSGADSAALAADPAGAARAAELVGDVSRGRRQLTRQLHPSVLEEAGLEPAVRGLVETLVERTGAAVQCEIEYPDRHREDAMIYGVARELLTNVARHAGATTVWLTLRDGGDVVTLDVRDDGVGIDPAVISRRVAEGHIGLASQRSRVETMGGSWEFEPVERGTWVRVTVPVRPEKEVP